MVQMRAYAAGGDAHHVHIRSSQAGQSGLFVDMLHISSCIDGRCPGMYPVHAHSLTSAAADEKQA